MKTLHIAFGTLIVALSLVSSVSSAWSMGASPSTPPPAPTVYNSEFGVTIQTGVTVGDVVRHFAPVWYHDVASGGPGNLGPRMDYYMALDYDGEMRQDNNWDNMTTYNPKAVIYYAFFATSTHYFLGFSQYHGRDWEQICTGLFTECHEGDMESIWMIVKRTPDGYGEPWIVHTGAHGEKYWWTNDPNLRDNVGNPPNGRIDFESDAGEYSPVYTSTHSHLRVYTQAHGHGPIVCRARETRPLFGFFGFGTNEPQCIGAPYEPSTFPGDSGDGGIIFRYSSGNATPYGPGMEDYPYATVDYAFYSYLDTIWPYRTDKGDGRVFWDKSDYRYYYKGVRCTKMGDPKFCFSSLIWFKYDPDQFINDNSGNAGWASDWGTGQKGDLFFDPAVTYFWKFNLSTQVNSGAYSLSYIYNRYIYPNLRP